MDISYKAQNSNITPKKDIKTVMSPIDSITSQDDNFSMDLWMMSEPDLVNTSNVETKFSPTETKNVISKNTAVLSTNSYDTHISNTHNNSENTKGSSHITNEVSEENISDAKNLGVLNDAEMLLRDSNTSQDNDIQMDNPPMNESLISEPNVEVKSFPTETKKLP